MIASIVCLLFQRVQCSLVPMTRRQALILYRELIELAAQRKMERPYDQIGDDQQVNAETMCENVVNEREQAVHVDP